MLEIQVQTGNDAFIYNFTDECRRILNFIASEITYARIYKNEDKIADWQTVTDSDGNSVGQWRASLD